jgi:hypothetical protein
LVLTEVYIFVYKFKRKIYLISDIFRLREANYLPLPSKIKNTEQNFALALIAKCFSRIIKTSHHQNPQENKSA